MTVKAVSLLTIKVHPIQHEGKYFTVPGIHICEPSPQRTPVLYQAGASSRGQKFASQNAECVFIAAPSKLPLKVVQGIRQNWSKKAATRTQLKFMHFCRLSLMKPMQNHRLSLKNIKAMEATMALLTLLSGWSGVDFSQYQPTDKVEYIQTNAIQSLLDSYVNADPERVWTIEEIANWNSLGGNGPVLVGSAETVSDALQQWVEDTDVDGFNLAYILAHQTFADVVEFIVPELQNEGISNLICTRNIKRKTIWCWAIFA